MKLSIVIPAYNEERLIGRCLAAVEDARAGLGARGWESEVVVCDNNSTDRTAAIAREQGARVVFEPFNQISRARNCGAAAATGDWLLFLDADSFPSRELFLDMADCMAAGQCLGGGANLEFEGPAGRSLRRWVALWNWLSRVTRWAAGSFLFCDAVVFRAVGGFSEALFVSEELELSQRLKRYGRQHGRSMVILRRHRLQTSPRKLHLYSLGELARFLALYVLSGRRLARRREACAIWYDGRR